VIGYFDSRLNEPVRLYGGAFELRLKKEVLPVEGEVLLQWLPQPRLLFRAGPVVFDPSVPIGSQPFFKMLEGDVTVTEVENRFHLQTSGRQVVVLRRQDDAKPSRIVVRLDVGLKLFECVFNDSLDEVLFHIVNLTSIRTRREGGGTTPLSRITLRAGDWVIELQAQGLKRNDTDEEEFVGFVFTHSGLLKREDGKPFTTQEATDLLEGLYYFLSFTRGRWCWPSVYIGRNANQFCWLHCSNPKEIDQFTTEHTIFQFTSSETAVTQGFKGFLMLWNDPEWRQPLQTALRWYVEANTARSLESAIVAGATALELVAWIHVVEREKTLSTEGFDRLPASDRLKLMFKFQSVPVEFPSSGVSELKGYAEHRDRRWEDGARTVTELRNSIVHPRRREALYHAPVAVRREARDLTLWYLSCVILRLFGYAGELPEVERRAPD
jgi:hypothetical protein